MTDEISILVPTWNRSKFLPLFIMNLKSQTYPHDKLTIIIDDDGDEKFIKDIDEFKSLVNPMKVIYIDNKPKRTIGKKRNDLIKMCQTKIFCFMDDDDIYFPSYISHSYEVMKHTKAGCVGSNKMLFCMTDKDYSVHAIDCGNNKALIHEATIMATKKWYKASCGFERSSRGEGKQLFTGIDINVGITNIQDIMLCLQHSENTVDKLQFAREDNKLNIEISDELKIMLDKIFEK